MIFCCFLQKAEARTGSGLSRAESKCTSICSAESFIAESVCDYLRYRWYFYISQILAFPGASILNQLARMKAQLQNEKDRVEVDLKSEMVQK